MPEIDISFHDPRISMEYWWPRLEDSEVPTPETELVPIEFTNDGPKWDTDALVAAVESFKSDHAFIRSDRKAAHAIEEAAHVYAATPEAVDTVAMRSLLQMSDMDIPPSSIAIREWLDLDAPVTCYNAPVPTEVRVFVDEGEVLCHHLRTTEEDFDLSVDEPETILSEMRDTIDREWEEKIQPHAESVAEEFDETGWSVDFVRTTDGDWYCTDMALYGLYYNDMKDDGGRWVSISNHESGCPHNLGENLPNDLPSSPENARTSRFTEN